LEIFIRPHRKILTLKWLPSRHVVEPSYRDHRAAAKRLRCVDLLGAVPSSEPPLTQRVVAA
jgi:hypothetical protein